MPVTAANDLIYFICQRRLLATLGEWRVLILAAACGTCDRITFSPLKGTIEGQVHQ